MNARAFLRVLTVAALPLLLTGVGCASGPPPTSPRERFASPEAAAQAFANALRADDQAGLKKILAPAADDILYSGDAVADRADVQRFLTLYDEAHRIDSGANGVSTLVVGRKPWPFPVPITLTSGKEYEFDVETGADEILNRRIGRNELSTQQVCLAIVDAQRDYVALNPTGSDLPEYARKLVSDPGKKNGLYWPSEPGEPPSPMGPLVASAADEGYGEPTLASSAPRPPYHGFRYRLLTSQGPSAQGGAADYVVNGKLIGGFGVIAYPAQYGHSGITTFITNHDGIVYQRDLGADTQKVVEGLTEFEPGPGWTRCAEASQPSQPD